MGMKWVSFAVCIDVFGATEPYMHRDISNTDTRSQHTRQRSPSCMSVRVCRRVWPPLVHVVRRASNLIHDFNFFLYFQFNWLFRVCVCVCTLYLRSYWCVMWNGRSQCSKMCMSVRVCAWFVHSWLVDSEFCMRCLMMRCSMWFYLSRESPEWWINEYNTWIWLICSKTIISLDFFIIYWIFPMNLF